MFHSVHNQTAYDRNLYVAREHSDSYNNACDIVGGISGEKGDNRDRSGYIRNVAGESVGEENFYYRDENDIWNSSGGYPWQGR